jgi:hypothetical protein
MLAGAPSDACSTGLRRLCKPDTLRTMRDAPSADGRRVDFIATSMSVAYYGVARRWATLRRRPFV